MLGKKEPLFYGLEKAEREAYQAWLNQPEGKYHERVIAEMAKDADANALQSPVQGQDWHLFTAQREQHIGQGIALRRVAGMKHILSEA